MLQTTSKTGTPQRSKKTRRGSRGKRAPQAIQEIPVINFSEVTLSPAHMSFSPKGLSLFITNYVKAFILKVDTFKIMRHLHLKHFFSPLNRNLGHTMIFISETLMQTPFTRFYHCKFQSNHHNLIN